MDYISFIMCILFSFESRYIVNTDMHDYVRTIGIAKLYVNQTVSLDLLRIQLNDEINIIKKIYTTSKYLFIILTVIILSKRCNS